MSPGMLPRFQFDLPAKSGVPMDRIRFGLERNQTTFYYRRTGTDVMAFAVDQRGLDIDDLELVLWEACPSHYREAKSAYHMLFRYDQQNTSHFRRTS